MLGEEAAGAAPTQSEGKAFAEAEASAEGLLRSEGLSAGVDAQAPGRGTVYFIEGTGPLGFLKIGFTGGDVLSRVKGLQTGHPERLDAAYAIEGDERLEKLLHRFFEPFRAYGEWFTHRDDILKIVRRSGLKRVNSPSPAPVAQRQSAKARDLGEVGSIPSGGAKPKRGRSSKAEQRPSKPKTPGSTPAARSKGGRPASTGKPWEALGISRAAHYKREKKREKEGRPK